MFYITQPTTTTKLKKIRYLRIEFEGELFPYEIPAFRGAIVGKVGREHSLFHNHAPNQSFFYQYPLIQYKSIRGNPALLCLEQGVDQTHHLFQQPNWKIQVSGRDVEMKVKQLDLKQYTLQAWDKKFTYSIRNWIALSQNSYQDYQQVENMADRVRFLETKLVGNILSFAKGLQWHVDRKIEVCIQDLYSPKWVSLKGNKVLGFTANFQSNVYLPNYIGLGKSVSLGYGIVKSKKAT